jgi:hypothetical protein
MSKISCPFSRLREKVRMRGQKKEFPSPAAAVLADASKPWQPSPAGGRGDTEI